MGKAPILGFLLLMSLGAGATSAAQETPFLLADINRTPLTPAGLFTAAPSGFFRLGDRLLFSTSALDLDDGTLWSTDGTAEGTEAISSALCPAPCNGIRHLGVWNGLGLLQTSSGGSSFDALRLWRTDGTRAGTYPLTGPITTNPYVAPLVIVSSPESRYFYFEGCLKTTVLCVIFRSDGTRAGTSVLQGNGATLFLPNGLTFFQDKLYFTAYYDDDHSALWSTDGTPEGTTLVAPVQEAFYSHRSAIQATPSRLFFSSGEGAEDLWVTDGTPGHERLLADLEPTSCYPPPEPYCDPPDLSTMFSSGENIYFINQPAERAVEIWGSDGTESGTGPVLQLPPGWFAGRPVRPGGRWLLPIFVPDQQRSFLSTADDGFSQLEPLTGCADGGCPEFLEFRHQTDSGAWLFHGRDRAHGAELWVTDGTSAGTRLLADVCPGRCSGFGGLRGHGSGSILGSLGGITFFSAFPQPGADSSASAELWATDGTPEGTHRVTSQVGQFGFLGGLAYFGTGGNGTSRSQIWSTDGTAAGTRPVTTLRSLAAGSNVQFHPLGEKVVLQATDGVREALWTSDGALEGTHRFFDFATDRPRSIWYPAWTRIGGLQFFQVVAGPPADERRIELWRTDGTAQGTGRVATLLRQTRAGLRTEWNGKFLFQSRSLEGCSFWTSDGTVAGTREILPDPPGRRCASAVLGLGSRFLFVASVDGPEGSVPQVFVSNGTPEGTRQVSRIRSHRDAFDFDEPVAVGDTVFFRIFTPRTRRGGGGWELWRSDGAPEGTYRASKLRGVSDLYSFRGSLYLTAGVSNGLGLGFFRLPLRGDPVLLTYPGAIYSPIHPAEFTPVGDHLLFVAQVRAHGNEIWTTDGTSEGTRLLRDIRPGPKTSEPTGLTSAGNRVFFSAGDGEHGVEAWESDGTPEGTRLAWDLNPGGYSSFAGGFTVAGEYLYFGADDGETGFEPRAVRIPAAKADGLSTTRPQVPGGQKETFPRTVRNFSRLPRLALSSKMLHSEG